MSVAASVRPGWGVLRAGAAFVRLSALGGTLILPLLGAASTGSRPSADALVGLLVVGASFHLFAYVLNDIVDLPVDRTEPRRRHSPLVTGAVGVRHAMLVVMAQPIISHAVTERRLGGVAAHLALASAFVLLAAYDVWGKRCPVPPLTDIAQGLGWGALLLFGAFATQGSTVVTWVVATYVCVFIVMANGIHGALRDIANDAACSVRSTATWFGARVADGGGGVLVPTRMVRYAWMLHYSLLILLLGCLGAGMLPYSAVERIGTGVALIALGIVTTRLLRLAIRGVDDRETFLHAGMLHLVLILFALAVLLAMAMDLRMRMLVLLVFTVPLLAHPWIPGVVRLVVRTAARGMPSAPVLTLIRVQNCVAAAVAVVLGGSLSGQEEWLTGRLMLAATAVFLLVAAANAHNDICDVHVDSLHKPRRPVAAGRIAVDQAYRFAGFAAVGGVVVLGSLGWLLLVVGGVLGLLAAAYNRFLKSTVLVGNALVAIMSGATVVFGAASAGRVTLQAMLASVLVALFILSGEVLKCVADGSADAAAGVHTIATALPQSVVARIHAGLAAATCGLAVLPWALGLAPSSYLVTVVFGVLLPLLVASALLLAGPSGRLLHLCLYMVKFTWATGLVAIAQIR